MVTICYEARRQTSMQPVGPQSAPLQHAVILLFIRDPLPAGAQDPKYLIIIVTINNNNNNNNNNWITIIKIIIMNDDRWIMAVSIMTPACMPLLFGWLWHGWVAIRAASRWVDVTLTVLAGGPCQCTLGVRPLLFNWAKGDSCPPLINIQARKFLCKYTGTHAHNGHA